jgi:hypothetical protein
MASVKNDGLGESLDGTSQRYCIPKSDPSFASTSLTASAGAFTVGLPIGSFEFFNTSK